MGAFIVEPHFARLNTAAKYHGAHLSLPVYLPGSLMDGCAKPVAAACWPLHEKGRRVLWHTRRDYAVPNTGTGSYAASAASLNAGAPWPVPVVVPDEHGG
jgi:hypothetical protein